LVERLEAAADPGAVDGHRLLREDVLAGGDRGLDVGRAERRRRRQDHVVDVARQHLLVGIEADEAGVVGHGELVAEPSSQHRPRLVEPILEGVGHRHDADARRGVDDVAGGARAASAAADQADPDLVAALGEGSERCSVQCVGAHDSLSSWFRRASARAASAAWPTCPGTAA
jgi:hypothetical protein